MAIANPGLEVVVVVCSWLQASDFILNWNVIFPLRGFLARPARLAHSSLILHVTKCTTLTVSQPYERQWKYNVWSLLMHSLFPQATIDLLCVITDELIFPRV